MCGGKIGQLVRNPVQAVKDSASRVVEIAKPAIKAQAQLMVGDLPGAVQSGKQATQQTLDTVGLGNLIGKPKEMEAVSAPDIAGQSDQANADAAALSAAYKSRRRRTGAYSLFQAGPVLQQLAGAAPKATLLGG